MHPLIEEKYNIEKSIKNCFIQNLPTSDDEYKLSQNFIKMLVENKNYNEGIDFGISGFSAIKIPIELLRSISGAVADNGQIYSFDRKVADDFFKTRFGIDVSKFDIIQSPNMPPNAEGVAFSCGESDHYILMPDDLQKHFCSYDILIHEFGHIIEFAEREKSGEIKDSLKLATLSEAIAHYYQIIYMLEHSSEQERLGMLASVVECYLFLQCMSIMLNKAPDEVYLNSSLILGDEAFSDMIAAYKGTDILSRFFDRWKDIPFIDAFINYHAQRFGFYLALNIVKNKWDITELFTIKYPQGQVSIYELFKQTTIKLEDLFNFDEVEQTLNKFINGTLESH